jgi:hypothetical protein
MLPVSLCGELAEATVNADQMHEGRLLARGGFLSMNTDRTHELRCSLTCIDLAADPCPPNRHCMTSVHSGDAVFPVTQPH